MSDEEPREPSSFEEALRQIAADLSRSVERFGDVDVEQWLKALGDRLGAPRHPAAARSPFGGAEPHPLDVPTDEQGLALAALDSGRWTLEPGTSALASRGDGPGPRDALGLARELRVRDWLSSDGEITVAGRRALARWLDRA